MGKKGQGNLRQKPDGRWEGRFQAGYDLKTGKPITKYVTQRKGETKKDVEKRLRREIAKYEAGLSKAPGKDTVAAFSKEWLEDYVKPNLKPNTYKDYNYRVQNEILPYLGKKRLTSLTKADVQRWVNKLRNRPSQKRGHEGENDLSAKTVINIHSVLSSMLDYAVKLDKIPFNPATNIVLPKVKRPEKQVLPMAEIPRFLRAIEGDSYEYPLKIVLWTGMRQSELLGLTWEDVDLEKKQIHVRRQLQRLRNNREYAMLDTTKNGKQRMFGMPDFVCDWFREIQAQQQEDEKNSYGLWDNPENLVFTDSLGNHLIHDTMRAHFKAIVKDLGYPELRLHDLRHTFASIMLSQGGADNMQAVSNALGHYSVWFTYDVYSSFLDEQQQQFARLTQRVGEELIDLPQNLAPKSEGE